MLQHQHDRPVHQRLLDDNVRVRLREQQAARLGSSELVDPPVAAAARCLIGVQRLRSRYAALFPHQVSTEAPPVGAGWLVGSRAGESRARGARASHAAAMAGGGNGSDAREDN